MESLSVQWERLSLTEEEGSTYKSETFEQGGSHVVAAKFYTRRVLNIEAIARTFKSVWRTKRGFEVKDVGNCVVLFVLEDSVDAERIIMGEPWSYDKFLVSLQRLDKSVPVKELRFNMTRFWVQLHDLSIGDMNSKSACKIGRVIGEVQSGMKEWDTYDGSSFMRIRVLVDTSKSLCRERKLCMEDGKVGWVRFRYE